ncbi:MAG: hydroxyethylthiazole kinase [Terrimicrobiaceae bacterium]
MPDSTLTAIHAVMARIRSQHPLIHCLTNNVVKGFTANVLLAIGAAPAMVEHPEEAREFAAMADALLINLGTLDESQMTAMRRAIPSALTAGKPWVLDPVAVGALGVRTRFAEEIIAHRPTVIRGNASEILALAGESGGGRGVDSGRDSQAARTAARALVAKTGATLLVTGAVDYVVDSSREFAISNGHPLLTRVTGVGCAMGAINAACLAVADSPGLASVATAVWLGVAGELAAKKSPHPGSFQIALLDALDAVDEATIRSLARFVESPRGPGFGGAA